MHEFVKKNLKIDKLVIGASIVIKNQFLEKKIALNSKKGRKIYLLLFFGEIIQGQV